MNLENLYDLLLERKQAPKSDSYTVKLFEKGRHKIAQKVGEEATEVVIEAVLGKRKRMISESADLMYHLMVLWCDMDISMKDIEKELTKRHQEKAKS